MGETDRECRKAFYRALNLHQGAQKLTEQEEYDRYYVPIYDQPDGPAGPDLVREMATAIDFTTGGSVQLLSGYRGAGKTTELLRLERELDRNLYVPVYCDVEDYFNTELPLEAGAFFIGLAAGFVDNCEAAEVPRESLRERMWGLLSRLDLSLEPNISTEAGPVSLGVRMALRDDESFQSRVAHALKSNRLTFRRAMHRFFEAMVKDMPEGRIPVFIVDSIDHFRGRTANFTRVQESVEALFSEYASELALPRMHVIYTVPIYVKPIGWDSQIWPVLNVKVRERDGSDCKQGIDLLRDVLAKRAPGGDLERLLGREADRIIRSSGGLFRELFRLVSSLLLKEGPLPVRPEEIDEVERRLRSQLAVALAQEQWEILRNVKRTQQLDYSHAQASDAWLLQALGHVLCYRNGNVDWYGVHPLLDRLLDEPD